MTSDNPMLRTQLICSAILATLVHEELAGNGQVRRGMIHAAMPGNVNVTEMDFCLEAMKEANLIGFNSTHIWVLK